MALAQCTVGNGVLRVQCRRLPGRGQQQQQREEGWTSTTSMRGTPL
eukprot:SAG25_NODE_9912_length_353_cov_0.574803_1_plen_45_part_10